LLVRRPAARADAARAGQAADAGADAGLATRGAANAVPLEAVVAGLAAVAHDAEPQATASTRQDRTDDRFKSTLPANDETCSVYRTGDRVA